MLLSGCDVRPAGIVVPAALLFTGKFIGWCGCCAELLAAVDSVLTALACVPLACTVVGGELVAVKLVRLVVFVDGVWLLLGDAVGAWFGVI